MMKHVCVFIVFLLGAAVPLAQAHGGGTRALLQAHRRTCLVGTKLTPAMVEAKQLQFYVRAIPNMGVVTATAPTSERSRRSQWPAASASPVMQVRRPSHPPTARPASAPSPPGPSAR